MEHFVPNVFKRTIPVKESSFQDNNRPNDIISLTSIKREKGLSQPKQEFFPVDVMKGIKVLTIMGMWSRSWVVTDPLPIYKVVMNHPLVFQSSNFLGKRRLCNDLPGKCLEVKSLSVVLEFDRNMYENSDILEGNIHLLDGFYITFNDVTIFQMVGLPFKLFLGHCSEVHFLEDRVRIRYKIPDPKSRIKFLYDLDELQVIPIPSPILKAILEKPNKNNLTASEKQLMKKTKINLQLDVRTISNTPKEWFTELQPQSYLFPNIIPLSLDVSVDENAPVTHIPIRLDMIWTGANIQWGQRDSVQWIGIIIQTPKAKCTQIPFDMIELYDNDRFMCQYSPHNGWIDSWAQHMEPIQNDVDMQQHLREIDNDEDFKWMRGCFLMPFAENPFKYPYRTEEDRFDTICLSQMEKGNHQSLYRYSLRIIKKRAKYPLKSIKIWAIVH
jgi:hypothetical protein